MTKTKKIKSSYDELVDSLSPKQKVEFNEELQDLLISELILAAMEQDDISVRKLAKLADISPTIVQAMKSGTKKDFSMLSFFKILKGLGCKKFIVELNGQLISLDIASHVKK